MKKVKNTEAEKKEPMGLKKKILIFSAIGVVAVVFAVLMIIESIAGKIKVTNNTDLKLEYLKAYFVDAEGMMDTAYEYMYTNVEPNSTQEQTTKEIDLLGVEANFEIRFKFEGYEYTYLSDAGIFNEKFDGNIKITFDQVEEGTILMKVKAKNGLLPSRLITCDEEYEIYYETGEISD